MNAAFRAPAPVDGRSLYAYVCMGVCFIVMCDVYWQFGALVVRCPLRESTSRKKFIRKVRRFAGSEARIWLKKRKRKTTTAVTPPNRKRGKKPRKHDRPEHPQRETAPVEHEAHVAPTTASQDERSSSRSLLPIDYNPD